MQNIVKTSSTKSSWLDNLQQLSSHPFETRATKETAKIDEDAALHNENNKKGLIFSRDAPEFIWNLRLNKLKAFHENLSHCIVPFNY